MAVDLTLTNLGISQRPETETNLVTEDNFKALICEIAKLRSKIADLEATNEETTKELNILRTERV